MSGEKQKIISDICPFYKEYGSCERCNTTFDIDDPPCYFECMANAIINNGYRKQSEGEWIFDFTLDGDDFYKCSVCGRQEVLNELCNERNPAKHYPYCHCGAKMKGGAE